MVVKPSDNFKILCVSAPLREIKYIRKNSTAFFHSTMRSRSKVKKNETDIKSAASAYVTAMRANAIE